MSAKKDAMSEWMGKGVKQEITIKKMTAVDLIPVISVNLYGLAVHCTGNRSFISCTAYCKTVRYFFQSVERNKRMSNFVFLQSCSETLAFAQ